MGIKGVIFWLLVCLLYGFLDVWLLIGRVVGLIAGDKVFHKLFMPVYGVIWTFLWKNLMLKFGNMPLPRITGDKDLTDESALVMANHVSPIEFVAIGCAATSVMPMQKVRWVQKKSVIYVPFFGWVNAMTGECSLSRSWAKDQENMGKYGKWFVESGQKWLIIFPEGTRAYDQLECPKDEKKRAAKIAFMKERKLPPLQHLMYPRSKGAHLLAMKLREAGVKWVLDFTFGYKKNIIPSLTSLLDGNSGCAIDIHVRKIPIEDLPSDDKEFSKWMVKLYEEKDKLLSHFFKHDRFPDGKPAPIKL